MMRKQLFNKFCLIVIAISVSIMLHKIAFSEVILTDEAMEVIKGGACGPKSRDVSTYTGCDCYIDDYGFHCHNAVEHIGKAKCEDTNSQCCSIETAPLINCTVTYACIVDNPSIGCDIGGTEGCQRTNTVLGSTQGNTTATSSGSGCTPGSGQSGGGQCGL